MENNISISTFKWKDTEDVVEFLNSISKSQNTERELNKEIFIKSHKISGANPLKDCFVAKSQSNNVIGFMHLIHEEKIHRLVTVTHVSDGPQSYSVFKKFMTLSQNYAIAAKANILHTQITKSDSKMIDYLNRKWVPVKEYWILQCDRTEGLLKVKDFDSGNISHSNHEKYKIESLDLNAGIKDLTRIQNISFENHWGFCPNTEEEIKERISITNPDKEGILLIKDAKAIRV